MADNVLKPLMLGRGVAALGGMAAAGIFGMFIGATLLALGYQIFMAHRSGCRRGNKDHIPAAD